MYRLHTEDGVFPLNDLKDYGDYMVHFYGGKLIKHTARIYVYEDRRGVRYAIRIADENVVLEHKHYYDQYNCRGIYVGVRKSLANRMKMQSGDISLYIGLFPVPAQGEKIVVMPSDPRLKPHGYRR